MSFLKLLLWLLSVFSSGLSVFTAACSEYSTPASMPSSQTRSLSEVASTKEPKEPLDGSKWNEWIAVVDDAAGRSPEECATQARGQGLNVSNVLSLSGIIIILKPDLSDAFAQSLQCVSSVEFSREVDGTGIAGISN